MQPTTALAGRLVLFAACSAAPSVAQSAADISKAHEAITQALGSVDDMLNQIRDLPVRMQATIQLLNVVEGHAKKVELAQAAGEAAALARQIEELTAELQLRTEAIRRLRNGEETAEAIEGGPLAGNKAVDIRGRIAAAMKLETVEKSETALVRLEESLTSDASPDAAALIGLVRYRLADTLRQRAALLAGAARDDREAEKLLRRAISKYEEVCKAVEPADPAIGTSVHAAARHRIVQVQASLYVAYKRMLKERPGSSAFAQNAVSARKAAEAAFEQLQRLNANATCPDGRRVIDVAREDVSRLSQSGG